MASGMRASSWTSNAISGVKLRGPSTNTQAGRRLASRVCNCQALAGLWWRTGKTMSSGVTRLAPSARTASVLGNISRSAVEFAARVQYALPLGLALGTLLDDHIEVVAQLLAVVWVVFQ